MQNINNLCMGCMKDNGGENVCHFCGYSKSTFQSAPLLPIKTVLDDRYVVGKVIEQNSEGVTYIGWDNVLQSCVRIREFLPEKLCTRIEGAEFITVEHGCENQFNEYMSQFLQMARTLARNRELVSLFTVYDITELNGTAYYISENVDCITLEDFLNRNGGTLTWDQARVLMTPAISTIATLHNANLIHGGISPKTLVVCRDGKLRITGFTIADVRRKNGEISSELYPGYAAIEQYGFDGKDISAATDNYAFAACIYRTLIGSQPPEATSRVQNDKMIIPAKIAETIPGYVLDTMSEALQIMPEDRLVSTDKFKSKISNQPVISHETKHNAHVSVNSDVSAQGNHEQHPENKRKSHTFAYAMFALIITVAIALIIVIIYLLPYLSPDESTSDSNNSSISSQTSSDTSSTSSGTLLQTEKDIVPQITQKNLHDVIDEYGEIFEIKVISKEYSDDVKSGMIISQEPSAATELPKTNSTEKNIITVVLSMGSEKVAIPSLTGKTEDEARYLLMKSGFSNENIVVGEERYSIDVPYGTIVDIEPVLNSNEKISRDSKITLHLNSNQDALPVEE